ncbi:MAG: hypothetical protein AAB397_02510 [Patescibacteria group bacterium]
MRKDTIQYILINPLFVFSENETPLERDKKLQQFFDSPQTIQEVLVSVENTDKIRKITTMNYGLPIESARKIALLIRNIFLGELAVSEFINKITATLNIIRELAQKIALDINKEIFHQATRELKELQRKFQNSERKQTTINAPPKNLPVLEDEYNEKKDDYLEPVTGNNIPQQSLIKGNLVNLKNRQQ